MGFSGPRYGRFTPCTLWIGGQMSLRVDLGVVANIKVPALLIIEP